MAFPENGLFDCIISYKTRIGKKTPKWMEKKMCLFIYNLTETETVAVILSISRPAILV